MISIVIPVFNEEDNIQKLYDTIISVMEPYGRPFEVIFVNDGSTDRTQEKLLALPRATILSLARNSGQTSALDAGIHEAQGEVIVTLDGDMQNDPSEIPRLVAKLEEGYDVVSGWRQDRNDTFGRRLLSRSANALTARVTGLHLNDSACALKAYRREVLHPIRLYGEMHVFLPAYLHGRGARVTELPVIHHARHSGLSKHNFLKAVKNLFDLMTIKFLITMTGRPLVLFGTVGAGSIACSFIVAAVALYLKLEHIRNFGQTPLPILAALLFLSGVLFFMLGFLAELILRVYFETSGRTPYVIRERIQKG